MKFFTTETVSPKRARTPEGYLICYDVPLARTGTQLYQDGEVPVEAKDGVIRIERDEGEVFRAETIASAMGKDLVDDHPMTEDPMSEGWDVDPSNYRELTRGVVLNPRRGEGTQRDFLLGDVMVKDASAIKAVEEGKVELSCGYSADYETLGPGHGRQHNIIINHVALVDAGRCGPRCSIGDQDMRTRDKLKSTTSVDRALAALNRIRDSFKKGTLDEKTLAEGMEKVKDEMTELENMDADPAAAAAGGGHHIHIHAGGPAANPGVPDAAVDPAAGGDPIEVLNQRMAKIEAVLAKLVQGSGGQDPAVTAETGEEPADEEGAVGDAVDPAAEHTDAGRIDLDDPEPAATGNAGQNRVADRARARDSKHLEDRFSDVVARAEFLSPGMNIPTFDAKLPAAKTLDAMCLFRRRTLNRAWGTEDGKAIISSIFTGDLSKKVMTMTCDQATTLFNGAAELARVSNNASQVGNSRGRDNTKKTPPTIAEINARNREMHNQPKR